MLDFAALALECAPATPATMAAIVRVESGGNPYAIGVVGGRLARQPQNQSEAIATAKMLQASGWNFSMGLAQINRDNLPRYKLTFEDVFTPCTNLAAGARILSDCHNRARAQQHPNPGTAALSCYYSGNFRRGFQVEPQGSSYVGRVLAQLDGTEAIPVIPSPAPSQKSKPSSTPADESPVLLKPTPDAPPSTDAPDAPKPSPAPSTLVF